MEKITSMVGTLCICIFVTGILYNIGCFKVTEKTIKFVISIYILVITFKAAMDIKLDFSMNSINDISMEYQNTEDAKDIIIEQTQLDIENIIKNRLDEKNISYNSISVHILEQSNNITIDKIDIQCKPEYKKEVQNCIKDLLTENTVVVIGE